MDTLDISNKQKELLGFYFLGISIVYHSFRMIFVFLPIKGQSFRIILFSSSSCISVYNWTVEEVVHWLKYTVVLPEYAKLFRKHKIDGKQIPRY